MNPHRVRKVRPFDMVASLWQHRQLVFQMCKRDVLSRYKGSILGVAWSFVTPLFMLIVYTFFFSFVFKARWGEERGGGHADFAVILFAGLIVHSFFAECLNRAPYLIHNNVSYVKKIVFPLEIFPWVTIGAALFNSVVSVFILVVAQLSVSGHVPSTAFLLPVVLLPLVFMALGASWFLAAAGVYVKDIGQTVGLLTTVLLFVSPVFYPIAILPEKIQMFVMLNPLTLIIEESRNVLLYGSLPNWGALSIYTMISVFVAWVGFWCFQKARRGFADVL